MQSHADLFENLWKSFPDPKRNNFCKICKSGPVPSRKSLAAAVASPPSCLCMPLTLSPFCRNVVCHKMQSHRFRSICNEVLEHCMWACRHTGCSRHIDLRLKPLEIFWLQTNVLLRWNKNKATTSCFFICVQFYVFPYSPKGLHPRKNILYMFKTSMLKNQCCKMNTRI